MSIVDRAVVRRMPMPDIARFFGIFLVYYGHVIERIMYLKDPTATMHYKLIYSFHMVFFFLLAGFVCNQDKVHLPFMRFLKRQASTRLIPYIVFSALIAVLSLFFTGHFVVVDLTSVKGYFEGILATATGFPVFNIPLWFMACLLSVEMLHYAAGRYLKTSAQLLFVALACYLGGYMLTATVQFLPGPNFWFLHEAIVMYAFYLVGIYLRSRRFLLCAETKGWVAALAVVCGIIVWFTFNLNSGPFRLFDAVVIVLSGHGHIFWFPFTALCGSIMLLLCAYLFGKNTFCMFMGENSLILFCLNGVFYHFFNGPFAAWFMESFPASPFTVTMAGIVFTVVSLLACIPCILFCNCYVPQLVGKPAKSGPLLPAFVTG